MMTIENSNDTRKSKTNGTEKLSGLDFLFLIGLALFIIYLFLAHPWTTKFAFSVLILWTSLTALFLSMAPDYINKDTAKEWLSEYRDTKVQGLYAKIYKLVEKGGKYLDSDFFFILGILLTISAIVFMFLSGSITNPIFGLSYGAFLRAILA